MYLVFTRTPGESYSRRFRSLLLCLCDVFRAKLTPLCVDQVKYFFNLFKGKRECYTQRTE